MRACKCVTWNYVSLGASLLNSVSFCTDSIRNIESHAKIVWASLISFMPLVSVRSQCSDRRHALSPYLLSFHYRQISNKSSITLQGNPVLRKSISIYWGIWLSKGIGFRHCLCMCRNKQWQVKESFKKNLRHCDGSDVWARKPGFDPRLFHVGFVMDEVHFEWFLSQYVRFYLAVSFHHCSTLIHSSTTQVV